MKKFKFKDCYNAKVGDIIEHLGKRYLIGDINQMGGVCDHCEEIRYEDECVYIGNIYKNPELIKEQKCQKS